MKNRAHVGALLLLTMAAACTLSPGIDIPVLDGNDGLVIDGGDSGTDGSDSGIDGNASGGSSGYDDSEAKVGSCDETAAAGAPHFAGAGGASNDADCAHSEEIR